MKKNSMKKPILREKAALNRIRLAVQVIRKNYPNLYSDAGAKYVFHALTKAMMPAQSKTKKITT